MRNKVEKEVQKKPYRILVVSQIYRNYKGMDYIDANVNCLIRIYAENVDLRGEDFKKKYEIINFFDTERSFNQLKVFVASGKFDLIHFSFHGIEKVVIFSDKEQIPYEEFKKILSIKTNTKVIILNICESGDIARGIKENFHWVLGWDQKVILKDAKEASETFYTSFFADNSVEDSFGSVANNKSINPVICENPKQTDNRNIKRIKRHTIILLSIVLILALLIVPVSKILNHGSMKINPVNADILQIISPPPGSEVRRNETLKVNAKLRSEGKPWIFILPPGGTEWWPQNGGKPEGEHWEFSVSFGNEIDSGRFRVLALIIKDNKARGMQEWYDSQGTGIQSDPLSDELVKSFFWYGADSADYYRIQQ